MNNNQNYGWQNNSQGYPYGQPMNNQGYYNQPNPGMNVGQPNRQVSYPGYNPYPQQQMPIPVDNKPKKNKKKIIILMVVLVLIVVAVIACIFLFGNKKGGNKNEKNHREISIDRTIMIYMVGSDLENYGNASAELNHIRPNNIDIKNNNIILIAGGSKRWGNDFIDPSETSIYQLQESGFEKVKQDELKNMGEAKTLSEFLNNVYDTYPSKKYELIFWNHGVGVEGIAYDAIAQDVLTFEELKTALEASAFKNEKLDSILFMNSLLGNIELASIVDDYANYMIASEELAYSHPFIDKFKFLEEIETSDDGLEFGKKFVDNLKSNNYLNSNSKYYNTPTTYSIIDLSKVSEINTNLNNFIKNLNVQSSYEEIALARSKTTQYGGDDSTYDMVDLYTLTSNLESLASSEAEKLKESISNAVVYHYSSDDSSKGLSIYFPYQAVNNKVKTIFETLETLSIYPDYLTFIKQFDSLRRRSSSDVNFKGNDVNATIGNFSMELTDQQKNSIAKASYIIVKANTDGTFMPVYFSDNTTIDSSNKLVANFNGKILVALDTSKNEDYPIVAYEKENGNIMTTIQLQKSDKSVIADANAYVELKNGSGKVGIAIQKDSNVSFDVELPTMTILTLENYQNLIFTNHDYKIMSSSGDILKEWQSAGKEYRINALVNHYRIQEQDLNTNERYYFAFKFVDFSNNVSYSRLTEIK